MFAFPVVTEYLVICLMNLVLAYPGCFGKKQNEFVVNFFYFLTAEMRLCCTG